MGELTPTDFANVSMLCPGGGFTSQQSGDLVMIDIYGGISCPTLKVPDPAQPAIQNGADDDTGADLEPLRGFRDVFPAVLRLTELNSAPQRPGQKRSPGPGVPYGFGLRGFKRRDKNAVGDQKVKLGPGRPDDVPKRLGRNQGDQISYDGIRLSRVEHRPGVGQPATLGQKTCGDQKFP
ncbi:hypothetical protein [Roseinatronobacter sp.]|uniref:hypothetical protein n=1 Tax=Roseinatronobacter sp. TaxID=1945755 RepID=UPI003F715A94